MTTSTRCQRCGGNLQRDVYGDTSCLQCGRTPPPASAVPAPSPTPERRAQNQKIASHQAQLDAVRARQQTQRRQSRRQYREQGRHP